MAVSREFELLASHRWITRVDPHDALWQPTLRAELNALHAHGGQAQVQVRLVLPPSPAELRKKNGPGMPEGVDAARLAWEYQWHATYAQAAEAATTRWQELHGTMDPETHTITPRTDAPELRLIYTYSYDQRDPDQVARFQRWKSTVYPALVDRLSGEIVQWALSQDLNAPEVAMDPRRFLKLSRQDDAPNSPGSTSLSTAWREVKAAAEHPITPAVDPLHRVDWEVTDALDESGPDVAIIANQKPRSPEQRDTPPNAPLAYVGNMDPDTGDPLAAYQIQGYTWQAMRVPVSPDSPTRLWFLAKGRGTHTTVVIDQKTQKPRTAPTFQGIVELAHDAGASVEVVNAPPTLVTAFQTQIAPFVRAHDQDPDHPDAALMDTVVHHPWVTVPLGTHSAVLAQYHPGTGHLTPVMRASTVAQEPPKPWILDQASVTSKVRIHGQTFWDGFCASLAIDPSRVQHYIQTPPPIELIGAVQRMVRDPEWPTDPQASFPEAWKGMTQPPLKPQPWFILPAGPQHWRAVRPVGMDPATQSVHWARWRSADASGREVYDDLGQLQAELNEATPAKIREQLRLKGSPSTVASPDENATVLADPEALPAWFKKALAPLLSYTFQPLDDPTDMRWRLIRPTHAEKWIAVHPGRMQHDGHIPLVAQLAPYRVTPQVFTRDQVQQVLRDDPAHYYPTTLDRAEDIPARWQAGLKTILQSPPDFQPGVYRWMRSAPQASTWVAVTVHPQDDRNPLSSQRLTMLRNPDALHTPRLFTAEEVQSDHLTQEFPQIRWHTRSVRKAEDVDKAWQPSVVHLWHQIRVESPSNPEWRSVQVGQQPPVRLQQPTRSSDAPRVAALTRFAQQARRLPDDHPVSVKRFRGETAERFRQAPTAQWIAVRPVADGSHLEIRRVAVDHPSDHALPVPVTEGLPYWANAQLLPPTPLHLKARNVPAAWRGPIDGIQRTLQWINPADRRWRLAPVPDTSYHIAVRPDTRGRLEMLADPQTHQPVWFRPRDRQFDAMARFAERHQIEWHPSTKVATPPISLPPAWTQQIAQHTPNVSSRSGITAPTSLSLA